MRILHVLRTTDPAAGGVVESVRQMGLASQRAGHQVTIAALDQEDEAWGGSVGLPTVALGRGRGTYGFVRGAIARLRAVGAAADLVVADGLWQYHSLLVHRVFAGRKPYVVYPHGMLDPWFKRRYPLKHVKKCLYWPLEYPTLRDADAVIFTAAEECRLARESFSPYRVHEVVLPFGTAPPAQDAAAVEAQRAAFAAACPAVAHRPFLLFLSRIHPKKGLDLLLAAFHRHAAAHPDLHLVVAGPDPDGLRSHLMQPLAASGLEARIHWPGMLRGDAKWGAFRAARAFCLPSHQENFGIVIAEALACRTPVLTTTQVNIWREVVEAGAGLAVADTAPAVADMLGAFLATPAGRRQDMGERGLALFDRAFAIEAAAATRNAFFAEVVARQAPRAVRPGACP